MPMPPNDRCSFEVFYKRNADGVDEIDHVIVRTGASDAGVTLTIPQISNLARLLNVVQQVSERTSPERNGNPAVQALPRAHSVRVE